MGGRMMCMYQRQLRAVLGGCLYPARMHSPSADNAADDGSRLRELAFEVWGIPFWLYCARRGSYYSFDWEVC